jgi:UDP:flavonoid glycosyltransferase YjiC (YdhE family)
MLIEPYCNDQFFNARRVQSLGVGGIADPLGLTVERLIEVLRSEVLTDETRSRSASLSERIRAEDGLRVACDLIEGRLAA